MSENAATIESTWKDGESFLDAFTDGEPATLVVSLDDTDVGDVGVVHPLLIRFEDRELDFRVHAIVLSRNSEGDRQGLEVAFLPQERDRLELILIAARGESLPYRRRRHERVPCRLSVKIVADGGRTVSATTTEISAAGAHISLATPLEPDQAITLTLKLPDGTSIELAGRITDAIDAGPQQGNGIEFLFNASEQRDTVANAVETLKED